MGMIKQAGRILNGHVTSDWGGGGEAPLPSPFWGAYKTLL